MNYKEIIFQNNQKIISYLDLTNKEKKLLVFEALNNSIKKIDNTINTWQRRNKIQILSDFLIGDLAKLCYKKFLIDNNLNVTDFDSVRQDNFKNHDKFDLLYNNNNIEVKSSLEKYTCDLEVIINKRRIIDNKYSTHINKSNVILQVFFIPNHQNNLTFANSYEENLKNLEYNQASIKYLTNNILNYFDIYLMGWTTRDILLNQKSKFNVENKNTNSSKREYTNFYIINSFNNKDLIGYLTENKIPNINKQKLTNNHQRF